MADLLHVLVALQHLSKVVIGSAPLEALLLEAVDSSVDRL
jgi:hypothetical protein